MAHISVVIPVYMAQDILPELYSRLKENLEKITTDFEIVLVEDYSSDHSWEKILDLAGRDTRVKGMKFTRNFGQHFGITAGLDICDGDWVVVMDCDLQDRPEEIPRLYGKAMEGYEIVTARRSKRNHPFIKRTASRFFYKLFSWLSGVKYDWQIGNFKMVSRSVVDVFRSMREQFRFFSAMVDWMGFESAAIEVRHDPRISGKSTYTLKKLFKLGGDTIIAYTTKPLTICVKVGFAMSLLSFMYGGFILIRAILKDIPVQGWSSLIVSLYFLCGIIIAILGIIGIYLGRIYSECKSRPLYIVHETVNLSGGTGADSAGKIR